MLLSLWSNEMKLNKVEHRGSYVFALTFNNDELIETDLSSLIEHHVAVSEVNSARIDPDWGCLEFKNGAVDIEPKTLYQWAESHNLCHH
jgi:hypothetical protein